MHLSRKQHTLFILDLSRALAVDYTLSRKRNIDFVNQGVGSNSVCIDVARWVNLDKNDYIKMKCRYPTTMYECISAQMYVFLVERCYLQYLLNKIVMVGDLPAS